MKTVKRFFSDKVLQQGAVNLVEHYTILSDDHVVTYTFNNYFNNIVEILLTLTNKNFPRKKANGFNLNLLDLIEAVILKYKTHPSLNAIRGNMSKLDNPIFSRKHTFLDHLPTEFELKKKKSLENFSSE